MDMNSCDIRVEVHEARTADVGPEWSRTIFPYPHHRIYWIKSGDALLKLRDQTIQIQPGYIYLLPAFCLVEAICTSHLSHAYIHFNLDSNSGLTLFDRLRPNLSIRSNALYEQIIETTILHVHDRSYSGLLAAQGSVMVLLSAFFTGAETISSEMARYAEVLGYIGRNLGHKITLSEMADLMHVHPVYFSNQFTKTVGLSPRQYLLEKRLEKAQILLLSSDKPIQEVAYRCGFDNPLYFSRIFRNKLGISPRTYRRIHQDQ